MSIFMTAALPVLAGISAGLAFANPTPITVGCAVMVFALAVAP